jgi:hypothetical protein
MGTSLAAGGLHRDLSEPVSPNWQLVLAKAVARLYLIADGTRDPLLASILLLPDSVPAGDAAADGSTLVPPRRAAPRRSHQAPSRLDGLGALRADPRLAIKEDDIRCLICGRRFRQLTNTHLGVHDTRAIEYKRRFGYNRGRPLMCRALQRLYTQRAVRSGLAALIRSRPILFDPMLRRLGGARAITLEELLTRRDARRRAARENGGGS